MGRAVPFLAWFLPHLSAILIAVQARRPTRAFVGVSTLFGLLLITPILVVLLLDLLGVLPSTGSRRWQVAAEFIWIGLAAPFWRASRSTVIKAAVVVMALAGIWTVASGVSWLKPSWELATSSAVIDRHGELVPVGKWTTSIRQIGLADGTDALMVQPIDGAATSQAGGLLSTADRVEALDEGFVRFPDKPYFLLTGRWSDGSPINGRRFRVIANFVSLESVNMEGCRGWRFMWRVGSETAANCNPQEWAAGEVEVTAEATFKGASGNAFEVAWFDMGGLSQRWTGLQIEEFKEGVWTDVTEGLEATLTPNLYQVDVEHYGGKYLVQASLPIALSPSEVWDLSAPNAILVTAGSPPRVRAWTVHPNQLAATIVVALATVAAIARRPIRVVPILFLGVVLLIATGSRSGFAAGLAIALAASIRLVPGRWKWWAVGVFAAIGALALSLNPRLTTLIDFSGPAENVLSRWDIAIMAWRGLWVHPWTGLGNGISVLVKSLGVPHYAVPPHAHNAWLEIGILFGVPAMLCALALTFIGVAWMLQTDRLSRSLLILPVIFLSLTDITTIQAAVAMPLALSILVAHTTRWPNGDA